MSGDNRTIPPDLGDKSSAAEEVTSMETSPSDPSTSEDLSRAVVPITAVTNWSAVVSQEPENDTVKDILRIVLKKTDKSATFYLSNKEKAHLVFIQVGIPRDRVIGIDQADFRTLRVYLNCDAGPFKVAHSIQVKDGLVTLPMRMFRRLTKVLVQRVGVDTDKSEVTEMLEMFGSIEEPPRECTYYEGADLSKLTMEEKMMRGVKNGDVTVMMYVTKHIPCFAILPGGGKVKVKYPAQPVTCARCHQGVRGCKGGASAAKCEKKGGKALPLTEFWRILTAEKERYNPDMQSEKEIPGDILLVEGLGKDADKEWLKLYLGQAIGTGMPEDSDLKRSEDKLTWEVTGLHPADIRSILESASGTQFKGRTVYCTPVVSSNIYKNPMPKSPPGEKAEGDDDSDLEAPAGDSGDSEPQGEGEDDGAAGDPPAGGEQQANDDWIEARNKSAEKKKLAKEKKQKEAREKKQEQEAMANLKLLRDSKPKDNKGKTIKSSKPPKPPKGKGEPPKGEPPKSPPPPPPPDERKTPEKSNKRNVKDADLSSPEDSKDTNVSKRSSSRRARIDTSSSQTQSQTKQ